MKGKTCKEVQESMYWPGRIIPNNCLYGKQWKTECGPRPPIITYHYRISTCNIEMTGCNEYTINIHSNLNNSNPVGSFTMAISSSFLNPTVLSIAQENIEIRKNITHYKDTPTQIYTISPPKTGNFQIRKISDIFHISAQNIDCGYSLEPPRRGGSNEYLNLCFWAAIKKIMYTPVNPSFTIKKWGLRRLKLYRHVFVLNVSCAELAKTVVKVTQVQGESIYTFKGDFLGLKLYGSFFQGLSLKERVHPFLVVNAYL